MHWPEQKYGSLCSVHKIPQAFHYNLANYSSAKGGGDFNLQNNENMLQNQKQFLVIK